MSLFLTDLEYRDNDGETWTLIKPLVYYSTLLGRRICVPAGFETDMASIPQFAQSLISKDGPWDWPAVIHDYLYATQTVSKKTADSVLREAMTVKNVPAWKAFCIYQAVNWFGSGAWKDDQKKYNLRKS